MYKIKAFLLSFFSLLTISHATLDLSDEGTFRFAQNLMQKYEEVNWLLADDVKATLQGKPGVPQNSWSVRLTEKAGEKGRHCIEFERTVHSVLCLHVFNQGDKEAYEWFVQNQKNHPLTWDNFSKISKLVQKIVAEHGINLIETNLILGDLGKTPKAHALAAPYGITEGDHDIFLSLCLAKCPEIFPSYAKLIPQQKEVIQKYAGLLHFGHLWHVEGTAQKMLHHLKKSGVMANPSDFDFEYVTHICDIAAVLAHVSQNGSLILTDDAFETIQEAMETVRALASKSPNDALQIYLDLRAKRIGLDHIQDLDTRNVLARLAAMIRLRVRDPQLGQELLTAWQTLTKEDQTKIIGAFNPLADETLPTPTYIPAVLENMRKSLAKTGLSSQDTMNAAIGKGLLWVARVVESYQKERGKGLKDGLTLNFNWVGGRVNTDGHALDSNPDFVIDTESGEVTFQS